MTIATLNPDNTITLTVTLWSETFPVDRLPSKLALYRSLRDGKGKNSVKAYEPTVRALEAIQRKVQG